MWFLIGSRAIKEIKDDFYRDINNSDLDLYCSKEDFEHFINTSNNIEKCFPLKRNKYRIKIKEQPIIELKIYDENSVYDWLSKQEQQELLSNKHYNFNGIQVKIPNLNCLKNIKKSHLYWPISWLKNVNDYSWLKKHTLEDTKLELIFAKKIRNEMKKLHGKVSNGKIKELNDEIIKNLKNEVLLKENDDKKVIFIIHEKLSMKNKLKIINNWEKYREFFFPKKSLKYR